MTELHKKLQQKFDRACLDNNLEIVKHLLESQNLKYNIKITSEYNTILNAVFQKHYFELGDYLFNQLEVTEEIKTEVISHVFANSCYLNDMNLIKILFNDEKYNKYLSLEYNSTHCFRGAFSNENIKVLDFLLLEAKLPKTNENIKTCLYRTYPENFQMRKYCEKLFDKQEAINNYENKFKIHI